MKRSEVNKAILDASTFFKNQNWHLPPAPKWDVTDFGLGDFENYGLVLINLAEEEEYCEKLMYARKGMVTPCHAHKQKKEDIITRTGCLAVRVWRGNPEDPDSDNAFRLKINGKDRQVHSGETIKIDQGNRITLTPGIYHEFYPVTEECILGEVSTQNDDKNDNYFLNPEVGRFSEIIEDEPPLVKLISDR